MREEKNIYKGNCLINVGMIVFIGLNIYLIFFFINQGVNFTIKKGLFLLLIDSLFYLLSSHSLFYFVLDSKSKTLEVKNCALFWIKKRIRISDIQFIKIEPFMKAGTGIRIITAKKTYNFACNFISVSDMADLGKLLIKYGVDIEVNVSAISTKMHSSD